MGMAEFQGIIFQLHGHGYGPSLIGMCSVRLQLSTMTLMSETKSSPPGVIPKAMRAKPGVGPESLQPSSKNHHKGQLCKIQRLNAADSIFTKLIGAEFPSHVAKRPYYSHTKDRFPHRNYRLEHLSFTLIFKTPRFPTHSHTAKPFMKEVF